MALNALTGGKHNQKPQPGLEGLASSLLGNQHQSSSGQSSSGGGGIAGQLLGSFLGGGKPQDQSSQHNSGGYASASASQHQSSGFAGAAASLFGGKHSSSVSHFTGHWHWSGRCMALARRLLSQCQFSCSLTNFTIDI